MNSTENQIEAEIELLETVPIHKIPVKPRLKKTKQFKKKFKTCVRGHEATEQTVYMRPNGYHYCIPCRRISQRNNRRRSKGLPEIPSPWREGQSTGIERAMMRFLEVEFPTFREARTAFGFTYSLWAHCKNCNSQRKFYHQKGSKGRLFRCSMGCQQRLCTTAHTLFRRTKTPMTRWRRVYRMLEEDRFITAVAISRKLHIHEETALKMKQTIFRNMKDFNNWFQTFYINDYNWSKYTVSASPSPEEWERQSEESQVRILARR